MTPAPGENTAQMGYYDMEERMCEVIGCGAPANWFVASEQDGQAHEQYLCHPHWRGLLACKKHHINRWVPLNPNDDHRVELPASGAMSVETAGVR